MHPTYNATAGLVIASGGTVGIQTGSNVVNDQTDVPYSSTTSSRSTTA